jgi:hypothetical protein
MITRIQTLDEFEIDQSDSKVFYESMNANILSDSFWEFDARKDESSSPKNMKNSNSKLLNTGCTNTSGETPHAGLRPIKIRQISSKSKGALKFKLKILPQNLAWNKKNKLDSSQAAEACLLHSCTGCLSDRGDINAIYEEEKKIIVFDFAKIRQDRERNWSNL